jgi:uncharacterized protein (DUF952 family)
MPDTLIYKICSAGEWAEAERRGAFTGSAIDLSDGFIHFSTAGQVIETARRHFAGQDGLVLVTVDTTRLERAIRWEPSRGGDLFPHLYGPLPVEATVEVQPLPMRPDGTHSFPPQIADAAR